MTQRKGQKFKSQEHLHQNEKSTSITSNHSNSNNMSAMHKSKPSIIRSVGGEQQNSFHLQSRFALKKDDHSGRKKI